VVIYLDSSALVALFLRDAHTDAVRSHFRAARPSAAVSSFATAEFGAVVGVRVRSGALTAGQGQRAVAMLDAWVEAQAEATEVEPTDHRLASILVRRFDLALRAPDALHIAVAHRLGLPLLTFDRRQAAAARALGVACDPAGDA
jgi:hypothetical protein